MNYEDPTQFEIDRFTHYLDQGKSEQEAIDLTQADINAEIAEGNAKRRCCPGGECRGRC